jgi:peptidoglycan/LPS O-acetylase OafA/YrhL
VRAIDGLRAVALALVLLFHAEVPGFDGGFLGVSLFFTLSGYLITQLLLGERTTTGSIGLGGFWARRVRRLAPASMACLLIVSVLVLVTDWFPGPRLPGDVVAAATEVANWRFAVADVSYADLFRSGPSPVLHFWSLSIEEQFYLLFPLVVVATVGRGRHRAGRRPLAVLLGAGWLAGAVASVVAAPDIAYYGTHTRAPELLAGALLALALPVGRPVADRTRRAFAGLGVVALLALVGLALTTHVTSGWLYGGGLPGVSLVWCVLLAATVLPGPVSRLLGWGPAVALGRRSYGMYVYHWPVFLVLAKLLPEAARWQLVPLQLAATVAIAWASFTWLEEPIRSGRRPASSTRARPALALALSLVIVAAVLVPAHEQLRFPASGEEQVGVVAFHADDEPPAVELDVLVVGSEPSVVSWVAAAEVPGAHLTVRAGMRAGCPLAVPDATAPGCPSSMEAAQVALAQAEPDLVVIAVGESERAPLHGPDAPAPEAVGTVDGALWGFARSREILLTLLAPLPRVPTLIVDTASSPGDPLATVLDGYALGRRDTVVAATGDPLVVAEQLESLAGLTHDHRRRLLVLGDSTSFEVAQALDELAGRRLDVVWAGALNCPLATTAEIRWQPGLAFPRDDCPTPARQWPEVVAEFEPEAVLGVWSIPELADQRYPDDDEWYEPGDEAYSRAHDEAMAALQTLLVPTGAVTIVATSPPFAEVATAGDFGGGPLGDPDRLAAWSAQVARWDESWRSVALLDWGRIVVDAEVAAGGPLRSDGLHLDPGAVRSWIGDRLIAELDASIRAAETDATGAGCLAGIGTDRVLVLDRCRTAG